MYLLSFILPLKKLLLNGRGKEYKMEMFRNGDAHL
jgi:hypothetical protein